MNAWERRLRDLWTILENCHATYMEPELFRLNTNQFLQTSRTVTFIIQKNKESIPNFESWYQTSVLNAWKSDKIMVWAKDSRNLIEKEGDLELFSKLDLTLFFSYIIEQDTKIQCGRTELLKSSTKKLLKLAHKNLPPHLIESSAIKIERYWVANSLPDWELLHAMSYIYRNIHQCCHSLALHLGSRLDSTIESPTSLEPQREIACQIQYLKLSDLDFHTSHTKRIHLDKTFSPPQNVKNAIQGLRNKMSSSDTIEKTLDALTEMAEHTFLHYGNHVPMLFLFNSDWKAIDMFSVHFNDRVEKYIFWRNVADRIKVSQASGIAWIGESWIRNGAQMRTSSISELPITGERLHVSVLGNGGEFIETQWEIIRASDGSPPGLRKLESTDLFKQIPYYLAPSLHVLGIPYPEGFLNSPAV